MTRYLKCTINDNPNKKDPLKSQREVRSNCLKHHYKCIRLPKLNEIESLGYVTSWHIKYM